MALWQFTTFTVLIGALIVYAIIITRRLGVVDARLTRMEEALLLARSGSVNTIDSVNADVPAAAPSATTRSYSAAASDPISHVSADPVISEVFETPVTPAAEPELPAISAKPQVSAQEEARRVYLTMRDLRARSEQRATATLPPTPEAVPQTLEALQPAPSPTLTHPPEAPPAQPAELEPATLPATASLSESVPATLGADAAPATNSEPTPSPLADTLVDLPSTTTLSENAAATILESGVAPTTSTDSQISPDPDARSPNTDATTADDAEAAAKKNQETLVFLNAQRRRRRAHLGY